WSACSSWAGYRISRRDDALFVPYRRPPGRRGRSWLPRQIDRARMILRLGLQSSWDDVRGELRRAAPGPAERCDRALESVEETIDVLGCVRPAERNTKRGLRDLLRKAQGAKDVGRRGLPR